MVAVIDFVVSSWCIADQIKSVRATNSRRSRSERVWGATVGSVYPGELCEAIAHSSMVFDPPKGLLCLCHGVNILGKICNIDASFGTSDKRLLTLEGALIFFLKMN